MARAETALSQSASCAKTASVDCVSAQRRWLLRLFRVSVLKQQKWKQIRRFLGPTDGLRGLDVGSDNGVISFLLRSQGGGWISADLDAQTVEAIRAVVGSDVLQITPDQIPCQTASFDRVVLIDCLEHVADDVVFAREVLRVTKPGGAVIVNVPFKKDSLLRRFRLAIGQTDEAHGHVRPGYKLEEIKRLFGSGCSVEQAATYSKFFSEVVDTFMVWAIRKFKGASCASVKGTLVTNSDLKRHRTLFWLYTLLYPLLWFFAQLDRLLGWRSGYMLIARLRVSNPPGTRHV